MIGKLALTLDLLAGTFMFYERCWRVFECGVIYGMKLIIWFLP
jgi:hypothetical protein